MAKENKAPSTGEETKKQAINTVVGAFAQLAGFSNIQALNRGTYNTYRKMRKNPTIALARSVATAPIRTSSYVVKAKDDAKDEQIDFITEQVNKWWYDLVTQSIYALDYGWMPFEKVWDLDKQARLVYKKLKPLLVDITSIVVDKDTGGFNGLKQKGVELGPEKCFVYTYDGEAGNLYGRSRHENIRESAYVYWQGVADRSAAYSKKIAGIIPMVQYPEGETEDEAGTVRPNHELAKKVLEKLGTGNGVAMPNTMLKFAGDLARSGIDLEKLKAWQISFLETKGQHGKGFADTMRHIESLMMRGWLVPERVATEGQHGTKAESESQASIALVEADITFTDMLRMYNKYIINPMLVYNYGPDAADTIWLERGGLDPLLKAFYREIIKAILDKEGNVDLFMDWVDVDGLLDAVELPKAEDTIVIPDADERAEQKQKNLPPQLQPGNSDADADDEGQPPNKAAIHSALQQVAKQFKIMKTIKG